MNWYYVEQGKQTGPVTDEQFYALLKSGAITADTFVWREGMAEWLPYSHLQTSAAPDDATGTGTATESAPQVVCAECGKFFPATETIRYGDTRVCADCKPVFLQKLQEGAEMQTGIFHYGGFWIRLLAYFLDFVILFGVNEVFRLIVMAAGGTVTVGVHTRPGAFPVGMMLFMTSFQLALPIVYETLMVGRYGATLGKMALKLKVIVADGHSVSYPRAFGRYFAKILSSFTCLIGYIIAGFDNPQKRALHDYICNTRVVYKQG